MHSMVIGTNRVGTEYQGFNCIQLKKKGSKTKKIYNNCPEKVGFLYTDVINLLSERETLTSEND